MEKPGGNSEDFATYRSAVKGQDLESFYQLEQCS